MEEIIVHVKAEDGVCFPSYATDLAAGADVCAHISEKIVLQPQNFLKIPTGLYFEIPKGYEVQIRPRSGLAFKHGITVLNTPGTIDADYRGEIGVLLINHGKEPFTIQPKMRIAQLILAPVCKANFQSKKCLSETLRLDGGFGHTGV